MQRLEERLKSQLPCGFGARGICCKICLMGPCRIIDEKSPRSVCGAGKELLISRNVARFVAGGASAHIGHAHHLMRYLKINENKFWNIKYIKKKAPKYLLKIWGELDIIPHDPLEEVSETLHATTFGVNSDYKDIIRLAMKLGIVDGYYGLYTATELEDRAYGKPKQKEGHVDLGVIDEKKINIAVHGHEPMLAEALVKVAEKNKNINLVGVCCTGASLLARHKIPLAANVVFQEEVVATGAIEALVVDTQCVMPSLSDLVECYHTKLITTSPIARMKNAAHLPVEKGNAEKVARQIIKIAKENYKNRRNVKLSNKKAEAKVGFTENNFEPKEIKKKLENGEIKGIVAVVGCANPRVKEDWCAYYKKLSKDYFILTTGCMAFEFARLGMLDGEKIFHLGSCVNNARIAEIFKGVSDATKKEIADLPLLVSCPRPITEKAVAIGFFFASLGANVHFGYPLMLTDSKIQAFLAGALESNFRSKIFLESNPKRLIDRIHKGL